ncbi:MAG: SUF system NifU family Fe-S cluster assembly protein [Hydrogenophilales bacterium CG17_big_fil_post_rev_8_21_14_2_50_63_12]|nr:MAG: SUF system NifU family Fe-S cluster assembly protein [Hydrogenophilales bacterium CG17_big_fil_post_rev_8_21_14_2_50_63_12]PIX95953.1 MAG: SUF system NifU family Fe-S cluster assembly protein [Hydrogenophilales bacterium CG_4_10_14_3_um_filter_63_21]
MNPQTRDLYEQVILEHNRHPRHYPENPPGSNHHAHGFNPLCNDEVSVHLKVEDGVIQAVGFEGAGCAVSMASASMMAEAIQGKTLAEVSGLFAKVHAMLAEDGSAEGVGKLKVLAGVKEFPMRVKCATLPWHTLQAALENHADTVSTEEAAPSCPQPA